MLVLHIITSLKIGGAESSLRNLLKHFKSDKNNKTDHCVIYFHDGPNSLEIKNLGIPTYHIQGIFSAYDPIALYRLLKLIYEKIQPDIIHSALWSSNIISRVIGWLLKIPVICDLHSDCSHHGKLRNFLERIALNLPCRFVAVSNSVKDSFENYLARRSLISDLSGEASAKTEAWVDNLHKISVINNGLDISSLAKNSISKTNLDNFVVGSVGRLVDIKNYDVLLKAFALLDKDINAKLCLIGDGPKRDDLEDLAEKLNIKDSIKFFGEQEDSCKFYPSFDCFVLPSKSEGMSISLLEALSFGLPIVTTHYKNSHDVIVSGVNGFLVTPGNEKELCDALLKLYKDKNLRKSMCKSNLELSKSKFDIKKMASEYKHIYESCQSS